MKKIISNILAVVCICSLISYCFFRFGSKEIDEFKEYISRIEQELNSSQEKDVLLQNDILALQSELGKLREELTTLNGESTEQQEYINELKQKVALLEARVDNLSGAKPKFTEVAPVYTKKENYIECFKLEAYGNPQTPFEQYMEYCRNNFPNDDLFLLACIDNEYNSHPLMYRTYSVLCESIENDVPKNVIFYESFDMYSNVLGRERDYLKGEGDRVLSISFEIFIKPLKDKNLISGVRLKFGELQEDAYPKKYINLYLGGECFATCFYASTIQISIKWFTDYFINYFVYVQ